MLNFEEELKKFKPSLEVEDIENAVYQEDLSDMTDILREMMDQKNREILMDYKQKLEYQSNYWYNDGLKKAQIRDLSGAIVSLKKKFAV